MVNCAKMHHWMKNEHLGRVAWTYVTSFDINFPMSSTAKQCPFNMVYEESGSPCMDTCTHRDTSSLCEDHKMDGCFCPPGQWRVLKSLWSLLRRLVTFLRGFTVVFVFSWTQGPCSMIFPWGDASLSPNASANMIKSITPARFTDRTQRSGMSKGTLFLWCYESFVSSSGPIMKFILLTWDDVFLSSTCSEGRWHCKKLQSPVTCAVEEGSHITTFDGKTFSFHGDCYYTLAKVQSKVTQQYHSLYKLTLNREKNVLR